MTAPSARTNLEYALVSGTTGLVPLLGLCPLLAVSGTAVNALGLGVATVVALALTHGLVSTLRRVTGHDVRIPAFVLLIAAVVMSVELAMRAFLPDLHAVLGHFIPLIATPCALMGRAEACASRQPPARAALDGFAAGLGLLWVLLLIGAIRELVGHGTVFAGAGDLLHLPGLETRIPGYPDFLLAVLPSGAFLVLAMLVAARQGWRSRRGVAP